MAKKVVKKKVPSCNPCKKKRKTLPKNGIKIRKRLNKMKFVSSVAVQIDTRIVDMLARIARLEKDGDDTSRFLVALEKQLKQQEKFERKIDDIAEKIASGDKATIKKVMDASTKTEFIPIAEQIKKRVTSYTTKKDS